MNRISCVLFDLGGVLLNWENSWLINEVSKRFQLSEQKLSEEFNKNADVLSSGRINEKEFWFRISNKLNSTELTNQKESIFAEIFRKFASSNESILSLSKNLVKKGITVGILSNTEPITYSIAEEVCSLEHFKFKFLSYKIGYTKPDVRIYQYVIDNIPYGKEKLFFIDDIKNNVESALSIGIDSVQFSNYENLINEFSKRDLL